MGVEELDDGSALRSVIVLLAYMQSAWNVCRLVAYAALRERHMSFKQ